MKNRIAENKRGRSVAICLAIIFAAVVGISALLATPALAATETIIYNFTGSPDGSNGYGGLNYNLIQDAAGNLYGATYAGGIYNAQNGGEGTVFELSRQNGAWVETIRHSFGGPGDGRSPNGGLVMDQAGNLDGVLYYGPTPARGGAVYELTPDGNGNWTETILKTFGVAILPAGGLTLDANGNLYGILQFGSGPGCPHGCGAVYELSPPAKNAKKKKWKRNMLYHFLGPKYGDGQTPNGDLVFDASGNLYGTTQRGGAYSYGTVFELSPGANGWTEKILHSFGGNDGAGPSAGMIFDAAGNLYGTTGGGPYSYGTVFELSPNAGSWTENVLYSFLEKSAGAWPDARVTFYNGNLYGTTIGGGAQQGDFGVVFELTPSGGTWTENVLHSFSGPPNDGWELTSAVIFDSYGNLYGVANGGANGPPGNGVVYEISQ